MDKLKDYFSEKLQTLNIDTVRKDIPVSSSLKEVQIWSLEANGENQFIVSYSVDKLITEAEDNKNFQPAYEVTIYVEDSGNRVLVKNPTITSIPKKSDYTPKAKDDDSSIDSTTTNEIMSF